MTDFEKLMQNSETMRMLKIGNPERSKDFGIPELQSGLFELERQTKANLENLIYTSPDPNGSIIKHDTALMLNDLGLDMETSRKLAEGGFASTATGIDTRSKSYNDALITKAQHAYWNEMRGVNASLYRVTGNPEFLKNAQEYDKKVFQNPVFESYGEFGDLTLDSVQPVISSAKFLLTNAILSWIPGGVANKVWGSAVAKLVAKGGGIAATGVNFLSTGYSQAGNVLYDVMQMTDGEGNTLPWDSPVGGILFHSLAGLMGLVELGSMEMFPWYKQLKSRFTSREVADYLKKGIAKSLLDVTFKGVVGTAAESIEEGFQSGLEDGFSNALKALANKDGADFDLISLGDSVKKGAKAFWDAGRSMFLTSFLSAGIGQSAVAISLRAKSLKNFNKTEGSYSVDSSFVSVPRVETQEEQNEGKEEEKLEPIRVANVGTHLAPINEAEAKKASKAKSKNAEAMEVIVEDLPPMGEEDKISLINRAAIATEGKILNDESVAFKDENDLNRAVFLLSPHLESSVKVDGGVDIVLRDENGSISKIPLRIMGEGDHASDPDISYYDDPEAPYSLARVTKERALEWAERDAIRSALGDLTSHTKGKISSAGMETNIDAIKLAADTIGISTDQMLSENLLFKLESKTESGDRGYINNITVNGKKQYTIHLTEDADTSTLLHELGHFIRGTATKEQLAEFTKHYGKGSAGVWIEDINLVDGKYVVGDKAFSSFNEALAVVEENEEAFANDFVRYLRTGEAPTEGLTNIFRRMKAVLQSFVFEFGGKLDEDVRKAFDNLLGSSQTASLDASRDGGSATLKQVAPLYSFYRYQDGNMEKTHKRLFYIDGMNTEFAERVENAGDIGRELSKLDGGSGWVDHYYIGEKMRKLGRVINDDGTDFYLKDFMELPATEELRQQEREIIQTYKDQYNAYAEPLGTLGDLSKALSFAVLDRDVQAMEKAWVDFIVEWNKLRKKDGVSPFPISLYRPKLRAKVLRAEMASDGYSIDPQGALYQRAPEFGTPEYARLASGADPRLKDADGSLRIFFHGSDQRIDEYDETKRGFITGSLSSLKAFFFTDSREVGTEYAENAAATRPAREEFSRLEDLRDALQLESDALVERWREGLVSDDEYESEMEDLDSQMSQVEDRIANIDTSMITGTLDGWDPITEPVLNKVYLTAPNLMVVEGDVDIDQMLGIAKADGYDGVYFKDISDSPSGMISDNVAIFSDEHIHSVITGSETGGEEIEEATLFQKAPPEGSADYKVLYEGSKAVDKNGKPLVLYHGSPSKNIEEFDNTSGHRINGGEPGYVYATDRREKAEEFSYARIPGNSNLTSYLGEKGRVYPVHMSIKAPLDFRSLTDHDYENMKDAVLKYAPYNKILLSVFDDAKAGGEYAQAYLRQTARELVEHLGEYGYDGMISEMDNEGTLEYAVISSAQVHMAPETEVTLRQASAYHGTPYLFDKFSTQFIGSGEGAQAFGWGLYFTSNRRIAEHYAETLTNEFPSINYDGRTYQKGDVFGVDGGGWGSVGAMAMDLLSYSAAYDDIPGNYNSRQWKERVREEAVSRLKIGNGEDAKSAENFLWELDLDKLEFLPSQRKLYSVTLHKGKNPSEYKWLDWNEPLDKNDPIIKGLLEKVEESLDTTDDFNHWLKEEYPSFAENPNTLTTSQMMMVVRDYEDSTGKKARIRLKLNSGQDLYKNLEMLTGSARGASLMLLEAGIDGNRYPAASMGMGDGSQGYNYVVFDENVVTIEDVILFQKAPAVGSAEFGEVLSGTKVADKNGNPVVVYHGSSALFDEFELTQESDHGYLGAGFYFSGHRSVASIYASKHGAGTIYSVYLQMRNPLLWQDEWNGKWDEIVNAVKAENPEVPMGSDQYGKLLTAKLQEFGYDGVLDITDGVVNEAMVVDKSQIWIDGIEEYKAHEAVLHQNAVDDRYLKAVGSGDLELAARIVEGMARDRGYLPSSDFRMQHRAPNSKDGFSVNLANLDGADLVPKDFWDHPRWYAGDHELYSFWKVREALDRYRRNGKANIRLYRAVPKNVREDMFRNGDWVTPDREYARTEGLGIPGGYRIIVHAVPLEHVWWDVNSVAEFGYDDGNEYAYRNTLNNRKLMDTIVRDDEGNIILPSQRFKYRNYTLYQKGDPLLRSYLRWEPEITSTGVIKGAPEWVKDRKDFNRMMHDMRKYLHEGASGRYWYEESAEAVWKMMRGDSDKAKKFIQLLAIYSPNNNVPNNTLMAIRAYAHWAAGLPEDELSSGMGELDEKARRALYHDEEWDGRKTNSFYTNLMYELVRKYPNEFPDMEISDVATMDLWMARAFGYLVEAFSDDKGTGKYSFSENITRRLTAEMNAKLLPGEEPWTPHQVQAAIWSSMKTRYEMPHVKEATNKESLRRGYSKLDAKGRVINPSSGETEKLHKQLWRKYATTKAGTSDVVTKAVEENGFSFSEAIYDSSQIVTWEAVPSASIGAAINRAGKDVKRAFTREALSLIIDAEGNDLLGARLGVPVNYSKQADGAYEKSVTPNVVTSLFPARVKGESISYDAVRDYARAIQYIFMQDAVPFFRPNSMPLVSKAAKEELQFKVVRYDRDRDGRITKVTTIPKSKADTQSEAEEFAKAYLENHKEILPENIAVHGGKYARGMIISFKNKLDDDILEDVLGGLVEYIGDDAGFTRTTENQIIVNNYRDDFSHAPWMHDEDFLKAVDLFIEDQGDAFGITDSVSIYTEGEYGETYDWSEGRRQGTEEALKRSFAGRPDLQEWLDDRRAHFEAILERYSGSDPAASEGGQSLVRESDQAYYGSFEGNPLVKHDLGEDYGRENLAELAESIDGALDQIRPVTVGKDQGSDAGRPTRNLKLGLGDDAVLAAKGWSVLGDDPHLWGYDGTEQSPTVDGDWKQFRKIDFKGTRVKGARQLAKLFSIYRNPRVEYFHVILTKRRANGVVEIVGNHAMSLGLPGFASAIPKDFPQDIITLMDQSGANEYYLLHNHPSGNIKPSVPDYNVTKRYIKEVPGFKGHIILDHDKAEFIDKKIFRQTFDFSQEGGYHHVPMLGIKHIFSPLSPAEVAKYALGSMTEKSSLVMYVNTQLEVVETEATDIVDMNKIFKKIKKNSYSWIMLATKDRNVFDDAFNAQINLVRSMAGYFTKDIILLNSDGTYESVADSSFVFQREDTSWLGREMERKYKSGNARELVFEGPTLYQLSEEAKRNVLDRRKEEVRRAVEEFYWIPDEILEEYSGEEWADREIKFRERLKEFPHLLSTAKEYVDPEEYLAYMESEIGPINAKDEEFYRRVFEYSRIMTPEEKDAQFTRLHTGTDRALVSLGKALKGYLDVDQKLGKIVHRWGSFRGVSTFVKQLNEESSDEDIQKARALVQQNPRPYRRALQYIEQAQDRVRVHRGEIPNGYADRDAFYDSIGEDIQDALDSPIDYDDMTDRESSDSQHTSADARESLASQSDVLALEREADAELKTLGAETERDVKEVQKALKRAQDELAKARKALEAQGDTLRALEEERKREGSPSQLKKELEERRARVKELRSQLTEANEQVRKLTPRVEALEKREAARRLRDAIERLQKKIREKATFRSDTLDASYEPMFNAVIRLFGESIRPVDLPEQMGQYLDDQLLGMIMHGKPIGEWSLADLQKMLGGIHLMRLDARVLYERRVLDRQNRLQNIAVELYRQSYGENPEIRPGYRTVIGDILDDLTLKRDQYQENLFTAVFNTIKASIGKMQRIARMLDGDKEGVLYNLLVRKAYENQSEELRRSLARLQAADEKMNELGIDNKYLAKDAYTYKTYSGQEKTLSRGEVIGLYVYQQNPIGLQKLVHNRGNGISLMQINEAIATLSDKDKMWGDFMIDTLGGDDTWVRMRDVYYEVYNKNLGRRPRYFTFVADGVEDEGNMDIINGAMRDSMRWVDKGMTKPVNVHAIYPLKLNVTQTFSSQIKRQEHFIQWAGWVRDMNYLMARGTVGQNIRMRFGKKYYDQVLEYIKDVGSPQSIMDDIEKLGSKIVSNAAVAALSLNALTMLKQLPSFASAVRGDIGAVELLQVSLRLINPKTHKEAVEFVNEMSPYMRKRAISVEVEKYQATEFDNAFSSWVQEFNEKVGMRGIQMMDHAAVYTLWLAAYDTYIRRNPKNLSGDALKSEAAFRATQLISETQPSSIVNDLSGIQRKKNPWVRTALLFSNQLFQYINMVWYDLPSSWKNYQATKDSAELRKMFGIVTNMAISGALIILVSGAAIRKDGEDDDDYWKRLRNEVLSMVASYTMPYIGGMVSQGMSGFYGGDLVDLPSALGRMLATDWTDWDAMNKRIWDMLDGVGSTQGLPTAFINRSVKAVKGRNPFELLGVNYGRLWERL